MTCRVTGDPLSCSISEAYLVEDSQGVGKGLDGFVQLADQVTLYNTHCNIIAKLMSLIVSYLNFLVILSFLAIDQTLNHLSLKAAGGGGLGVLLNPQQHCMSCMHLPMREYYTYCPKSFIPF